MNRPCHSDLERRLNSLFIFGLDMLLPERKKPRRESQGLRWDRGSVCRGSGSVRGERRWKPGPNSKHLARGRVGQNAQNRPRFPTLAGRGSLPIVVREFYEAGVSEQSATPQASTINRPCMGQAWFLCRTVTFEVAMPTSVEGLIEASAVAAEPTTASTKSV